MKVMISSKVWKTISQCVLIAIFFVRVGAPLLGLPKSLYYTECHLDLCRDVGQVTVLYSKQMILYTWDDPQGVRKLLWKSYTGKDKPIEAPVDKVTFCSTFPRKRQKRKRYFLFSSTIRLNA